MRQEPAPQKKPQNNESVSFGTTTLVGLGRLGRALRAQLLENHGIARDRLFELTRHSTPAEIETALTSSDRVLLCLPDREIQNFLDRHHQIDSAKVWIHFSATTDDPRAFRLHPLWSFTGREIPRSEFDAIPFAMDMEAPSFSDLLPGFCNPAIRLAAGQFHFYHSLCVLGMSLPTLLWSEIARHSESNLEINKSHFANYFLGIAKNFYAAESSTLTGPWVRGDFETTQRNRQALKENSPGLLEFYDFGLDRFLDLQKRAEGSSHVLP
jgi:2-dehydropantoate 2-reductase